MHWHPTMLCVLHPAVAEKPKSKSALHLHSYESQRWDAAMAGWLYCQCACWHPGAQADVRRALRTLAKWAQHVTFPVVPTELSAEMVITLECVALR